MAQVINTNIASLNAQRNLNTSQTATNTALQRLSTGLRINSAKDDAAGLAISERMTTQITGLNQAVRNANDGISLAQTAEGALSQIGTNLQRIRELSVQSRNATNSDSDRAALQKEVSQLSAEIGRVAKDTSFNGTNLIDGSFNAQAFQVGANQGQTISVAGIANANVDKLGNWNSVGEAKVEGATVTPPTTGGGFGYKESYITINGKDVTLAAVDGANSASSAQAQRAQQIANAVNSAAGPGTAKVDTTGTTIALANQTTTAITFGGADLAATGLPATLAAGTAGTSPTTTIDGAANFAGYDAATFTFAASSITVNGKKLDIAASTGTDAATAQAARATALRTAINGELGAGSATGATNQVIVNNLNTTAGLTIAGPAFTTAPTALAARPITPGTAANITIATGVATATEAAGYKAASFTINGTKIDLAAAKVKGSTPEEQSANRLDYIRSQINDQYTTTGVSASIKDGKLSLAASGKDITLADGAGPNAGALSQAGLVSGKTEVPASEAKTGFADLDISTVGGADNAILAIDAALKSVNESRADLGAIQNRFSSVVSSLQTTSENLSSSRSRILDTDFAAETASLTRAQILSQAGTAMLAQANSLPNNVLTLLRG